VIFRVNGISAIVDNATLAAAEISIKMDAEQISAVLIPFSSAAAC
jgi:predicted cation transporter